MLAAAIVLAAFAAGYLLGARGEGSSSDSFTAAKTAVLGKSPDRLAVVRIGQVDEDGNRPMDVSVDGLDRLSDGDYYTLFMTRNGKPIVTCGTFNVSDKGVTTVRLSVAYDLDRFDGLMLAKYSAQGAREHAPTAREADLGRSAVVGDERRVRDRHLLGQERLARLGVAPDLALSRLGGPE